MKTATLKRLHPGKAAGVRGPSAGSTPPPSARTGSARLRWSGPVRSDEMAALLGTKAELVQTLEGLGGERTARLDPSARRHLAARLQALSLDLLRVSVRLEEALDPATNGEAPTGAVARSSARLEATARRNREALVRAGELVTASALAGTLGISPQAVTKARTDGRFFAVESGGEDYYPVFYADPGFDRKVLEEVTRLLGDLPGAEKFAFFRSALGSLGDLTPLDALRAGKREAVERAARAFADR